MTARKPKKAPLPSINQAQLIARLWSSHNSVINIITRGRDGEPPYVDPTTAACIKHGWLAPNGGLEFQENGFGFLPHALTPAGLLALECFLMDMRIKQRSAA